MLKGVIFDMDGVLINSEEVHYKIWEQVMTEYGVSISYEWYKQYIGTTEGALYEGLQMQYSVTADFKELTDKVRKKKITYMEQNGFPAIEGTKELIEDLHSHGILLAVASSSNYPYIVKATKGVGIYDYFDEIFSGEDVPNPKPAPDVFLKAAKGLSLKPEECLVVEDSYNGVQAAKAAKMTCVGFYNPDSGNQDLSDAACVVEGFEEITTEFLDNVYKHSKGEPADICHTRHLYIRETTVDDLPALYELYGEAGMTDYMEGLSENREEEAECLKAYIRSMYGFFGYGMWTVIQKESGEIIGRAGLENLNLDGEQKIEIGYMIGSKYQRQGYAQEACEAVIQFAVKQLELKELYSIIQRENEPSVKLIQKLGFNLYKEQDEKGRQLLIFRKSLTH